MNRRKFLIGAGSLAAGSAAGIGTGAFTSVSADRSVSVQVADDDVALLGLDASKGENSAYAAQNNSGQVEVAIDDTSTYADANGVNGDARTVIFETFQVQNNGTQPVVVYVPPNSVKTSDGDSVEAGETDLYIDPQATNRPYGDYSSSSQNRDEVSLTAIYNTFYDDSDADGFENSAQTLYGDLTEFVLDTGDTFDFGLVIESDGAGSSVDEDFTMTLRADADMVPSSFGSGT